MGTYYDRWLDMAEWQLQEAIRLVCEYSTLTEGHESPKGFSISLASNTEKCRQHIHNDARNGQFLTNFKWFEITPYNQLDFPTDSEGNPINHVDLVNSYVNKKEFIAWALKRGFKVPEEFMELVGVFGLSHKDEKELVAAAMEAGIICEGYGSKIRRENLQAKLNQKAKVSTSKFELIWKAVPDRYKLSQGESLKDVEKAIKAAYYIGYDSKMTGKDPQIAIRQILKTHKLEDITPEHLDMIMKAVTAPSK